MTRPLRPAPFRTGTALERYERLEATGLWRESPGAAPREVVVAFGTETLVLRDLDDTTLGHWALAGLRTLRDEGSGRVYAMTRDGYETLAIRDPDMIAAIDAVTAAARGFPGPAAARRSRWPSAIVALALLAALPLAAPPLIRDLAARAVTPEAAERLGDEMLIQLIDASGPPCADPAGAAALARLADAVAPEAPPRVRVMALGDAPAAILPGRLVVLDRRVPEEAAGPDEVAGWIALALETEAARPAVGAAMHAAGPLAAGRSLVTGRLDDAALARAAASVPETPMLSPEDAPALAGRLADAGIPAEPLAVGLERHGESALAAALVASAAPASSGGTLLAAPDWAALRAICS
jgi:hypothetical protein